MRKTTFVILILLAALMTACMPAPQGVQIEIESPWVRAADLAGTSAAYMIIQNAGSEPDTLLAVHSEAAEMVQLHSSETRNGITMMSAMESVPVPARGKTELKPGGLHVMLMKLKQELKTGEKIRLTLVFEKSGEIQIEAEIKNP